MFIPVASPDLRGNEEAYVVDAIRTSWISSTGPYITRFEKEFAELCGTRASIAVCNGTVALHLALLTLDVRPGDEVIVPSLTYIATANAVRYVGAEPVFVDVDPQTWCMDPRKIEEAITVRTKGIIAVHLYGHPADMDEINHIAGVNGLWVVEDAAEAPLAMYKGRPVGSLSSIATFSFYGNKVITCGEGGALTLNDPGLELRARTLRGQGMDPKRRYYFPVTGFNFRLTNVACAMLCAQLEQRERIMKRRLAICARYHQKLQDVPGVGFQPVASWAMLSPWLFCITIDAKLFGRSRDDVMAQLAAQGIDSRPFFIPLHSLPPFREGSRKREEYLPVTNHLSSCGINLPTFSAMTDDQVDRVAEAIRGATTSQRKPAPLAAETRSAFVPLSPRLEPALTRFFSLLREKGLDQDFHPHPFTAKEASIRANDQGADYYVVRIDDGEIVAYGMLRGWDAGYETPSLGVAVLPEHQGRGIGRSMMLHLHSVSRQRGAQKIRLKVYAHNVRAIALYQSMGYEFNEQVGNERIGYCDIAPVESQPLLLIK